MEYTLTFCEAIEKCIKENAIIVAEGFEPGYYAINKEGVITLMCIEENLKSHLEWYKLPISETLVNMRFRTVTSGDAMGLEVDNCPYCGSTKYKKDKYCRKTYCELAKQHEEDSKK